MYESIIISYEKTRQSFTIVIYTDSIVFQLKIYDSNYIYFFS